MPANGETATVTTNPSVPVDISLNLLKREMALGGTVPPPLWRRWFVCSVSVTFSLQGFCSFDHFLLVRPDIYIYHVSVEVVARATSMSVTQICHHRDKGQSERGYMYARGLFK